MIVAGTFRNILDAAQNGQPFLVFFSGKQCSVCDVLKEKINALLAAKFPNFLAIEIDAEQDREAARQHMVFTVPTILICSGEKELDRFGRNLTIHQLEHRLSLAERHHQIASPDGSPQALPATN